LVFFRNCNVRYGIEGTDEIVLLLKSDTDPVAVISREKMHKKKDAPQREAKPRSNKTDIHISSECHQQKAGYARIRRKTKCPAMQDPQHGPGILEYEKPQIKG
jgi:hypothetical protein